MLSNVVIKLNLWVAAGRSLGAMSRFLLATLASTPGRFPWATLVINIAGSFAIGLIWGLSNHQPWFEDWGRYFIVIGFLGAFTTFSAFSFETVGLMESGRVAGAASYVLASLFGCVMAAWLGQRITG